MIDSNLLFLALEDFLPVLLSAAGLWVIARLCSRLSHPAGTWARAGLVLIVAGGVTKPIYKSLLALSKGSLDISFLDDVLFWLLAPGFVIFGAGVSRGFKTEEGATAHLQWAPLVALAVPLSAALLVMVGSPAWFFLLLGVTTAGNIWAVVVLVRWSRARQRTHASWFFVASLLVALGLAGAAASLEQTIPVQWGEQLASTAGQGLFLLGALRLTRPRTVRPS